MVEDALDRTRRMTTDDAVSFAVRPKREPLVRIEKVDFSFGEGESRKQVLFDNNLDIYPGEIVIMTGPSGSGKTTLLTLIGALRAVQSGSLKFDSKELRGMGPSEQVEVRKNIGFIFQAHNLFESLTAFQNVKLATELHDLTEAESAGRAREILVELGLEERMYQKPQRLSGGQQQRVAIGRALVNRPKLILADEPTAALDKDTGRHVVSLFQKLAQERDSTVLIVTHDNRILDVADRIISLIDGYVVSNVEVAESLTIATFLQKCPVFADSSPALLADVAGKMELETFTAGTDVVEQGDVGVKFYVVRTGQMQVVQETGGRMEIVRTLKSGDFFGEIALLKEERRSATVKAIGDVEVLSLSKDIFMSVVESSPSFEDQMKRVYFGAG